MQPKRRRDLKNDLRQAQCEWLDAARAHANISLAEIARRAGVNNTTLSRFRNRADHVGLLNTLTLRAVADATGFPLTDEVLGESELSPQFREVEAVPYHASDDAPLAAAVEAFIGARNHIVPWVLKTRALEYEGYRPGDIVLVDLNGAPRRGKAVCAQIYDFDAGKAEIVFRLYEPPFLIAAGPDEALRRPRLIDDTSVAVKGTIELSFRT